MVWIIGEGAEKGRLMEMAKSLGIEEMVRFTGFQEHVPEFLAASDIFVLPSRHEAMSMVLLEALASGLPSIVTDVGENAAVIQNGEQGFVIPPHSAEALRETLDRLLNDGDLLKQMSQKARLRAEAFSDRKMVDDLQDLYLEILGN